MSAKIYQFPTGGRAAVGGAREEPNPAQASRAPSCAASSAAQVACAGAWYHEEAVQAERGGKS